MGHCQRRPWGRVTLLGLALGWVSVATATAAEIRFTEVAASRGIDFQHHHGGSGERFMVETVVGGVVVFDFDSDGDEDVFFVDGGPLPGYRGETTRSRLFRNEGGPFVDHTDASGIRFEGYGSGVTAGDYDGDGDVDLYITAFGPNSLWQNQGDGRFAEVTEQAGVGDPLWSSAAAFADVDRDGDLDLYVGNYVDFAVDNNKFCGDEQIGLQAYCHPGAYNGLQDTFYRNLGDGTFAEATAEAGLAGVSLATLALAFGDLDDDGWVDLYTANDANPNLLFRNLGDGTFEEQSLLSGVAFGESGNPEAGMGVDIGDIDNDGLLDIFVTNFELETNVIYRNLGGAVFIDARFVSNVAEPSLLNLAFGVALADFDGDRDLDAIVANGHILDNATEFNKVSRYGQINQVLENRGDGRFSPVTDPGFEAGRVSRGLATGDLDGDGDLDVVVSNSNGIAELYENVAPSAASGLLLDLRSAGGNTLGIGARIAVRVGEAVRIDEVRTGSSYASQNALSQHFGLAGASGADSVEITWPGGARQRFESLSDGRYLLVEPR